jgi:hypothetical protein
MLHHVAFLCYDAFCTLECFYAFTGCFSRNFASKSGLPLTPTHPPEPTPHTFLDDIGVRATSVQFLKSHLCLSWLHSHGFLFDWIIQVVSIRWSCGSKRLSCHNCNLLHMEGRDFIIETRFYECNLGVILCALIHNPPYVFTCTYYNLVTKEKALNLWNVL